MVFISKYCNDPDVKEFHRYRARELNKYKVYDHLPFYKDYRKLEEYIKYEEYISMRMDVIREEKNNYTCNEIRPPLYTPNMDKTVKYYKKNYR